MKKIITTTLMVLAFLGLTPMLSAQTTPTLKWGLRNSDVERSMILEEWDDDPCLSYSVYVDCSDSRYRFLDSLVKNYRPDIVIEVLDGFDFLLEIESPVAEETFTERQKSTLDNFWFKHPTINIYPNPATEIINIETSVKEGQADLLNQIGQTVLSFEIVEGKVAVERGNLPSGIYTIRIGTMNSKLIIK
jgi:hypothetical protein